MNKKLIASFGVAAALVSSLAFAGTAFAQASYAQNAAPQGWFSGMIGRIMSFFGRHPDAASNGNPGTNPGFGPNLGDRPNGPRQPGIVGTVSSIVGTTFTLDARRASSTSAAARSYTVDASSAQIIKFVGTATSSASFSDIALGDRVMVRGTLDGTSVAATTVMDGIPDVRPMNNRAGTSTPPFGARGGRAGQGFPEQVNGQFNR